MVIAGIKRVERKLESALTLDAAVAFGGVTAAPGQDSADVAGETERSLIGSPFEPHAGLGALSLDLGPHKGLTVGCRSQPAAGVDGGQPRICYRKAAFGRQVAFHAVAECPDHQEALARARTPERQVSGFEPDGLEHSAGRRSDNGERSEHEEQNQRIAATSHRLLLRRVRRLFDYRERELTRWNRLAATSLNDGPGRETHGLGQTSRRRIRAG